MKCRWFSCVGCIAGRNYSEFYDDPLLRSSSVFVGSPVQLSFIFVELIGETLDLFVFTGGGKSIIVFA
jgi:hypothetical protein